METKLMIILGLLLIIGLGCGEPGGGGAGYQYLGKIHRVQYQFSCLDNSWTTAIKLQNDFFIVNGKVPFRHRGTTYAFIWINTSKNTIKIRQLNITSEHPILEWKTLDWRKNECK